MKTQATPTVIAVHDVSKHFMLRQDNSLKERIVTLGRNGRKHKKEFWALKNVSFEVNAGSTVGLIGHNGSGKSTLLKLIGGILSTTSGTVQHRGRLAALLELGAGFHPDLTGRENVYLNASILGLTGEEVDARFADIHAFSEIGDFIDTQVKFYSSGMYVRLAFAVAIHTDPDVLLIDEVLAVGDEAFQNKCLDKIRSFQEEGRTIVLVTHALGTVQSMCDRAILLDRGSVVFDGNPDHAVEEFRRLLEQQRVSRLSPEEAAAEASGGLVLGATARPLYREADDSLGAEDDLDITIDFSHPNGATSWIASIEITDSSGYLVFATSSQRLGKELKDLNKDRRITFILKKPNFGPGQYFVRIGLLDGAGHPIRFVERATSFVREADSRSSGTLSCETELLDHGVIPGR
ncbi:ABC transporter ATP-binding protein [Lysinibacter sp. HNR]|uniref:ABC transporter ATP-binding protein n=1 Tax=Lysinibacter sp. HNR TaxID=3031408 RepID=UPI002435423C|nr:ABC transporter ATP-binding protein [Lysinibacter sp. HNR]WGD38075.1 ABC transporter ATP-binding protein [Lysinibacter sp. HNR]